MASFWTNKGLVNILSGDVDLRDDTIKVMLLDDEALATKDINFVSEISADELTGSGYTGGFGGAGRKTLASKVFTENDTDDRAEFDAADVVWTAIDAGSAQMAAVIKEITNDGASLVLGFVDITDTMTNGGDLTINWAATGLFRIAHAA